MYITQIPAQKTAGQTVSLAVQGHGVASPPAPPLSPLPPCTGERTEVKQIINSYEKSRIRVTLGPLVSV